MFRGMRGSNAGSSALRAHPAAAERSSFFALRPTQEAADELILHAGLPLDAFDRERPPVFAERGEYVFTSPVPKGPMGRNVLVYSHRADGSLFAYIGVLRGAVLEEETGCLRFRRYEAFGRPVVAYDRGRATDRQSLAPRAGFAPQEVDVVSPETFASVLKAAGKVQHPEILAWGFAAEVASHFEANRSIRRQALRQLEQQGPAAHRFHRPLKRLLARYLEEHAQSAGTFQLVAEGLPGQEGILPVHSVLGNPTQPSARVLEPFRCAIDYGVQERPGSGVDLEHRLLLMLTHVASGSYDAGVLVYLLQNTKGSDFRRYLDLDHTYTRNFLEHLRAHNVAVAIIEPSTGNTFPGAPASG